MGVLSEQREKYRERLYGDYLALRSDGKPQCAISKIQSTAPYLRRLIKRHMPADRDSAILDLGCGYGALLHLLRQAGYRDLAGVDRSPEQVGMARQLDLECVVQANLVDFLCDCRDAAFDVVVAFDVLEHFTRDELLLATGHIHRVLRSGGRLIAHVPNAEGIFGGQIIFGDLTHETAFTRDSMGQLLRCAGFTHIDCLEDVPAVHGFMSALRFVTWKLVRSFFVLCYAAETGETGRGSVLSRNLLAVAVKP